MYTTNKLLRGDLLIFYKPANIGSDYQTQPKEAIVHLVVGIPKEKVRSNERGSWCYWLVQLLLETRGKTKVGEYSINGNSLQEDFIIFRRGQKLRFDNVTVS